ncbi:hypothetical protein BOTNAR_0055g00330 [Botryotinia narcissicola]|uniref:F-box domain-containing protein n=1 Tax=Botryotinia narcissicola TaxID=278944 RepID=A0A4Z1J5B6_9HELO|nr:hypothetical protein BOTNAR_0055g00330 [Botryotinia narcissicola]
MVSSDDSDNEITEINGLQNANATLENQTQSQQSLRCISRRKPISRTKSTTSALDKLPLEVRRMIYKELLVNPVLGTMKAIEADTEFGTEAIYGLTPAILRTCRNIYEEASEVLYDQTFIIKCDYNYRGGGRLEPKPLMSCPCPILRYEYKLTSPFTRLEIPVKSSAITQARSWKVLVDSSVDDIDSHQQFYEFCGAVCNARPKKIEIVMLKTGTVPPDPAQMRWLEITPTNELPPFLHEVDGFDPDEVVWSSHQPGKLLTRMLHNLAQSDRPVERLFQIRAELVILAQSFERYLPFKMDMNFRAPLTMRNSFRSHPEKIHDLIQWGYKRYTEYYVPNPNRNKDGNNDLEESLFKARNADLTMQNSTFKQHREEVVKQLWLQYNRVLDAAKKLKAFRCTGDQFRGRKNAGLAHWLLLIENYAAEFEREKNPNTAAEFRRQKRRFDNLRSTWPREIMLAKLDRMMEDQEFEEFETVAEKVEKDMDKQVVEMTIAWRELFRADVYKESFCQYKFDVAALRTKRVVPDVNGE